MKEKAQLLPHRTSARHLVEEIYTLNDDKIHDNIKKYGCYGKLWLNDITVKVTIVC